MLYRIVNRVPTSTLDKNFTAMARKPPRWLQPGDSVTIEIENIGRLTNPVKLEA